MAALLIWMIFIPAIAGLFCLGAPSKQAARIITLTTSILVLVMSVPAGFGGQAFDPVALEKLRWLSERIGDDVLLEVDGGINDATIGPCAEAGAQLFVAGSAIFRGDDYTRSIATLGERATTRIRT